MAAFFRRSVSEDTEGRPVQILSISEDTKQLKLHHDALNSVLCHPRVGKKRIAVISIIGACRTGKSFLLNFILRYLRNRGYEDPEWIGSDNAPLDGFSWSSHTDAHTQGIWMWNKPFIVKKERKEVAVFLADTQGHFHLNDNEGNNKVFVLLSMLLSSVTVFNVLPKVQENDIEFLELCIEYSERINHGEKMCPLQALTFVVRDWTGEHQYPYGADGGQQYRDDKILSSDQSAQPGRMTRMRKKLCSTFKPIDCFMMPPPGRKVPKFGYRGCLKDIDTVDGFIDHLKNFCGHIADPKNLVVKKNITGHESEKNITGHELMTLFIANFEALQENQNQLLDASSYEQLRQDIDVSELLLGSAIELGRKLDEILKHGHIPTKKFEEELKRIWEETCAEFRTALGADPERQVDRLKKYVTLRHFERCRSINKIAKLSSGNIAETALVLTINYGEKMNEAMKDVRAHEWEQKLNTNHDDGIAEANKLFSELSKNREYEEGLRVLSTGIDCVNELMKLEGPMKRDSAEYKWKKLIWDSIEEYRAVWNQPPVQLSDLLRKVRMVAGWSRETPNDTAQKCSRVELHGIARQRALKYFDTNAAKDSNEEARNELIQFIQSIATQLQVENESGPTIDYVMYNNEHIIKIRDELRIFEHKKKVLKEINEYSKCTQAVYHGSKFERILEKKRTKYAEGARQIEQTLTGSGTGPSLKEKVLNTVDAAFLAMKKRDESLKPFHDRILQLDIKLRRLAHLSFLGEKLDGAYVLPDVLVEMHRTILDQLLPKENEDNEILHKHRDDVKRALDQQMEMFKVWNEENKSIFKRRIGSVAGGLGFASGGAAGGTAAGLFFADIAIVTTVGAAVATGIGAAVVAGVLIVGGSIAAYFALRKKAGNVHITEQMEKINSGQPDEDEQEEQGKDGGLNGQEDTETN